MGPAIVYEHYSPTHLLNAAFSWVSKMALVSLSHFFIYTILITQVISLSHTRYESMHTTEVECVANSIVATGSKAECAFQCMWNEECSYFQQSTSLGGVYDCLLCTECAHTSGVYPSTVIMPVDTSEIFEGESLGY